MNFNFGEILTRAWQITWKYKVLWIFGILASCSQGSGGGGGGAGNSGFRSGPSDQSLPPELRRFAYQMENFVEWTLDNWWIFIVIFLVVLLLIAISVFLGTIGRIGLIKGSYNAEQEEPETLVFGELFSTSLPYFWRVFGLSFLIGLAFLLLLLPLVGFGVLTAGIGFMCLLPLICLLIPVGWVVSVIIEQANRAIVLEDLGIMDALRRAWEILRSNVGPLLIMSLILFGINFVAGLVIALPILIVVFPTMFTFFMGGAASLSPLYVAGVCIFLYIPISLVAGGILNTFTQSSWTLTYMRLTGEEESTDSPILPEPGA
jgi:hypothetical protein